MNWNFLLEGLVGMFKSAGKAELSVLLQKLHDSDLEAYKAAVQALHLGVGKLKPLAEKSKTKLDDGVLLTLDEAITESAAFNNITL